MKPFITDENISELDKHQEELIRSIRPFDICAEISKHLPDNLKQLLPNNLVKEYSIFKFNDKYTSKIKLDEGLLQWSRFMFEYNRISFDSSYITPETVSDKYIDNNNIMRGTSRYSINAIQSSNIYDILLESTMLSFSLLDENGLVKKIWDHDYFVPDISLRSLGSFFTFSEVITLNVKNSSISKTYYVSLNKDFLIEIENILSVERHNKDRMVSIQQQVYIKAFVYIYMIYTNVVVSRKMPKITADDVNIKTGYAFTIEKALLQRLRVTEDELRDMIYASNLVRKYNSYKKLRITTQGQGLLPVIQRSFKLQFPLSN
ncbi:hypothetical protein BDF21DRAFT_111047 [Thamnidium elegans]|nr:hypothetical protein BDF21DRAFT_111047 [Thamnidium elegans]